MRGQSWSPHRTLCLWASVPPRRPAPAWDPAWGQGLSPHCPPRNSPASPQAPPASSLWPLRPPLTPLGLSPPRRTSPGVNVCLGASLSYPPFVERRGGPEGGRAKRRRKETRKRGLDAPPAPAPDTPQLQERRCRESGPSSIFITPTTEPVCTSQEDPLTCSEAPFSLQRAPVGTLCLAVKPRGVGTSHLPASSPVGPPTCKEGPGAS